MEWFGKVKQRNNSSKAMLSVRKSKRENQYNIYFRNDIATLLKTSSYVEFAIDNNRLYFRGTDSINGTKLVKKGSGCFTKLTDNENKLAKFEDDYFMYGYNRNEGALHVEQMIVNGREQRR